MSGSFTGMDIGQVRELAQLLQQKNEAIEEIISTITSKLGGTQWVGNDRQQFESDWSSTGVNNLKTVGQMLVDTAQRANQNADQQEQASSS